ncbi:LysM peptidoglycan-binding domain-containing protein [Micromonospora sp. NBC_01813]|uniref:LysM peptidoglycan-binding domain-containing protein n=1 Tax=Micromonospora sp. NBC_01813 TaxID=2975988 RepID=UPI002DD87CBB|nr:hypothetical protein [Micromonospora sp. NBC_01813]WSA10337.1 hypothetical protein OG958_05955 [Micromonospora sp. NBC_01813]
MRQRRWAWQVLLTLAVLTLLGPVPHVTWAAGTALRPTSGQLVSMVEPSVTPGGSSAPGSAPTGSDPASAATPPDGESGRSVRYYVVEELPGGERDFLFAIAARTLGDGRRYREIFDLNVGQVQPDGGELTDPTRVEPGWVLRLPDDARGPGVRYGPLPAPVPDTSTGVTPETAVAAPDRRSELLIRGGAAMVAVGLFALAVLVLRRGGGARAAAPARPEPRPESRPRPAAAAQRPAAKPRPAPAPAPAPARSSPASAAVAPVRRAATSTADPVATEPAVAVRPAVTVPPAATTQPRIHRPPATAAPSAGTAPASTAAGSAGTAVGADASGDEGFFHLEATIRVGDDPAVLRLTGTRQARGAPPYRWVTEPRRPVGVESNTLVPLGDGAEGQLWVELRQAPDVLVITGPVGPRQRAARLLLDRLLAAGASATMIGTAIDPPPAGCRQLSAEDAAGSSLPTTTVTVFAEPGPETLTAIHTLASRPDWQTVPVVVSAGPPARWTLRMDDD